MFDFLCCGKDYQYQTQNHYAIRNAKDPNEKDIHDPNKNVVRIKKSNYDQIISVLNDKQIKFTDKDFPPDFRSLGNFKGMEKNIQWIRISDLYKNPILYDKGVQVSDIIQGAIGDCYFMSTVSAIAQVPQRIKGLFGRCDIKKGIYSIIATCQGITKEILIDDFIPTYKRRPAFSKPFSGTQQIWVMILEKFWAKLYGSYQNISGGFPHDVLDILTLGTVVFKTISYLEQSQIWDIFKEADKQCYPLVLNSIDDKQIQKLGLLNNHTYTFVSCYQIKGKRMIKLRNPWGFFQWKGELSDQDKFWSTVSIQQKKMINLQKKNDGSFFIPLTAIKANFQSMDYSKIIPGYNLHFDQFSISTSSNNIFEINIVKNGDFFLEVFFVQNLDPTKQKVTMMVIQETKENSLKFVNAISEPCIFSSVLLQLKNVHPGKYYCLLRYQEEGRVRVNATMNITLTSYSNANNKIIMLQPQFLQSKYNDFFQRTMLSRLAFNKHVMQTKEKWLSYQLMIGKSDFGYIAAHVNQNSSHQYVIMINGRQLEESGLELMGLYKGKKSFEVVVKKGETKVIVVRAVGVIKNTIKFPVGMLVKQKVQ